MFFSKVSSHLGSTVKSTVAVSVFPVPHVMLSAGPLSPVSQYLSQRPLAFRRSKMAG